MLHRVTFEFCGNCLRKSSLIIVTCNFARMLESMNFVGLSVYKMGESRLKKECILRKLKISSDRCLYFSYCMKLHNDFYKRSMQY